jgi:hypothetical protein
MPTVTYEQVIERIKALSRQQLDAVSDFLDYLESNEENGDQRVFLCAMEEQIVTETEMQNKALNTDPDKPRHILDHEPESRKAGISTHVR